MANVAVGGLGAYATDSVLPPRNRTSLFRSWGAMMSMLPVGGRAVWGDERGAPDDTRALREAGRTHGWVAAAWLAGWVCGACVGQGVSLGECRREPPPPPTPTPHPTPPRAPLRRQQYCVPLAHYLLPPPPQEHRLPPVHC